MPVVFIGHGNPMFAIEPNRYTESWTVLAAELPRPTAVLAVSAHWYVAGTAVTSMEMPRTIHDFGGFPDELFRVDYPAPGSPELADRARALADDSGLLEGPAVADRGWGLDHGSWAVLRHLYPDADVPVVQLSIDGRRPGAFHLELGTALAPLRDEGVLILASGNVVHNLGAARFGAGVTPFAWAERFEDVVRHLTEVGDREALVDPLSLGPDAQRSIPTPDHYLPLLYALGAAGGSEPARVVTSGIDAASISMLSLAFGG
jgi:4,5-DOPA dioxygenase extradiol